MKKKRPVGPEDAGELFQAVDEFMRALIRYDTEGLADMEEDCRRMNLKALAGMVKYIRERKEPDERPRNPRRV